MEWKNHILHHHKNRNGEIHWGNCNPSLWPIDYWELAKVIQYLFKQCSDFAHNVLWHAHIYFIILYIYIANHSRTEWDIYDISDVPFVWQMSVQVTNSCNCCKQVQETGVHTLQGSTNKDFQSVHQGLPECPSRTSRVSIPELPPSAAAVRQRSGRGFFKLGGQSLMGIQRH